MKLKLFRLPSLLLVCSPFLTLTAQPVITNEFFPAYGDTFLIKACEYFNQTPGDSGQNVTWDFTQVSYPFNITEFRCVNPSVTPYSSEFPEATHCLVSNGLGYEYYDVSEMSVTYLGGKPSSQNYIYTDPSLLMTFPFTYGTTHFDSLAYYVVDTVNQTVDTVIGTIKLMADAYGTLVTPVGTFEDVIRFSDTLLLYRYSQEYYSITKSTHFRWCSPKDGWKLFSSGGSLITNYYYTGGVFSVAGSSTLYRETISLPTSVADAPDILPGIFVYPNPSGNVFTIEPFSEKPYDLRIVDFLGREKGTTSHITGNVTFGDDLPEGVYFLQVIRPGERLETIRVIKTNF